MGNRPFWALFSTQFLGAFNENFFRASLITLITYHLTTYSELAKALFASAAFGLFMLPFFIFSPLAGQLVDSYDKSKIIRFIKISEVLIVSLSTYGFVHTEPYFLLVALFCMGVHSAFFGPAKYSILPDILPEDKLLSGNGSIEAGTFIAVMLGTLCGALMVHMKIPFLLLSFQLLCISLLGLLASWQIPSIPRRNVRLKIRFSWFDEMKMLSRYAREDERVFKAIISIAWFWLIGALLMAQLPPLAKGILKVEESVFIFLLLLFTVGIGMGSLLCNWLFKGEITTKYVPLLTFLMIPLLLDISNFTTPLALHPLALVHFLTLFQGIRFSVDILALAFVGGLYIVPLYTFIQAHVMPSRRSQVIAYNNIMTAGFMVFGSFSTFCLLSFDVSIPTLIFLAVLGQIGMTFYVLRLLPEGILKACIHRLLRFFYRLEVNGFQNYRDAGERVILIANYASYLDVLLIAASLPDKPLFVINLFIAQKWWIKPFLVLAKVFPVDPLYPYALRDVIEEAKKAQKILIFSEGQLILTESLMKIYEGLGMVAEKAEAQIIPLRIEGAQYTFFSLLNGRIPRPFFSKITLSILPPLSLTVDPTLMGRARRRALSEQIYDVMATLKFRTSPLEKTLFLALIESRKLYGSWTPILEDASRKVLTYATLLIKVFTLSRLFVRHTKIQEAVGIMLPNTHTLVVSFWALQATGRIPALLNYTSGSAALLASCQLAHIKHVFTSHAFIEKARLQETLTLLKQHKIHCHFFEDEKKKIKFFDKLWGMYGMVFSEKAYKKWISSPNPQEPCVILFTSGSEGAPKGVVLSHLNLQANRYQLASVVSFNEADRVLNTLPLFHAFGLSSAMILPLLFGIRALHYISPLHYHVVAELAHDLNATILFGTDTFLSGYGRAGHADDFYTLRYVFAGAEKLKEETRNLWFDKFGHRLFEGYGTTETGPVLCVNTPIHYKAGTVGRFLPDVIHRLDPVEGINEGGRLWVKGPNIMQGYLSSGSYEELTPLPEGWYDTGDVATIDSEGYVCLKGRLKRFAKIGGEIISLAAIEEALALLWPDYLHAIIVCPDPKKGEQVVLFTTNPSADRTTLLSHWKTQGLPSTSLPRITHVLDTLPLLGSGKVDYRAVEKLLLT